MTQNTPLTDLEERLAHMQRMMDDLSDVLHRQEKEIDWLKRRVHHLVEREAQREYEMMEAPAANVPPPHW